MSPDKWNAGAITDTSRLIEYNYEQQHAATKTHPTGSEKHGRDTRKNKPNVTKLS